MNECRRTTVDTPHRYRALETACDSSGTASFSSSSCLRSVAVGIATDSSRRYWRTDTLEAYSRPADSLVASPVIRRVRSVRSMTSSTTDSSASMAP